METLKNGILMEKRKKRGLGKTGTMKDYIHSGLKMVKKKRVYKNTKGIGLWTYRYPNGNIERKGYRNNGVKSRYWMYLYDTSVKKSKGNYFNYFKYGLWTFCYINGHKQS